MAAHGNAPMEYLGLRQPSSMTLLAGIVLFDRYRHNSQTVQNKKPPPQQGAKAIISAVPPFSSAEPPSPNPGEQMCYNGPQLAFYAGATSPITIERLTTGQLHRGGSEASSPLHPAGLHQPPALLKDNRGYYSSSLPFTIYEIIRKLPNPVKDFHENLSFPTSLCSLDYFFIHHSSEARTKFEDIKLPGS
jgi:hypothetical protein